MIRSVYPPLLLLLSSALLIIVHPVFFLLWGIFLFDFIGRCNDYEHLTSLKKKGLQLNPRLLERYGRTWCGRTVMMGVFPSTAFYYRHRGYRWYHVFPDDAFTPSSPFLKCNFWKNLFKGHRR